MGSKNKLKKFHENNTFKNVIQPDIKEIIIKNHILKLENLIKKSSGLFSNEIKSLVHKINELISQLSSFLSSKRILRIVGSFAILFGLTNNKETNAQSFNSPTINPF